MASRRDAVGIEGAYLEQKEYEQLQVYLLKLKEVWHEFFKRGGCVEKKPFIKREVLESWKRCYAAGLDPNDTPNRVVLSQEELKRKLIENRNFLEVATPFLEALVSNTKIYRFRVDLVDKDLVILAQYGDESALSEAAAIGSVPGVSRAELVSGTNAINLAAYLRRPVQLVGPEHYNVHLHYWTCSAVPIFLPENELIGIVNIAGHFSLLNKHTLGMAVAVGKVIEESLKQKKVMQELEVSNNYLNNIIHAVSDCLIMVNPKGEVITVNQAAASFLDIDSILAIGKPITEIMGLSENPFVKVLKTLRPIVNKEIAIKTKHKTVTAIAIIEPVLTKEGLQGVIGILKPLATAKRFIKQVAGFKAFFQFSDLVGENPEFKNAVELAKQAARLPITVLLQGESGTGKELFAQAIHNASPYRQGPFVALNCAAIPSDLVESELFGYEPGAFTGASKEGRPGKFELAEGGTLFLDEICSMPLNVQAKILRVLQTKKVMRIGGTSEFPVNVRLVCATNRDLWVQVQEGGFREDLYYRVNVLTIYIPPLRSRLDDLPLLVKHFCGKVSQQLGVNFEVDDKVYDLLISYDWPGNVRELENVIERAAVLALARGSSRIEVKDIVSYSGIGAVIKRKLSEKTGAVIKRKLSEKAEVRVKDNSVGSLEEAELEAIRKALEVTRGNLSQAARILGIHRTTLYRKLKKYTSIREWLREYGVIFS